MNDVRDDRKSDDVADEASESICVDLGDAVAETKGWSPDPWVIDNLFLPGWNP